MQISDSFLFERNIMQNFVIFLAGFVSFPIFVVVVLRILNHTGKAKFTVTSFKKENPDNEI